VFDAIIWVVFSLLVVLAATPVAVYLAGGWRVSRARIVGHFRDPKLIWYYFQVFPGLNTRSAQCRRRGPPDCGSHDYDEQTRELRDAFDRFYAANFGWHWFVGPTAVYVLLTASLLLWCALSLPAYIDAPPIGRSGALPLLAIAAILGGYVRTLYDGIADASSGELSPQRVLLACGRLVLSVPVGYALARIPVVSVESQVSVAFLLAFVPTRGIASISRRWLVRANLAGDDGGTAESELQRIEGIDRTTAERLADQGITTVSQLSKADPVAVAIRTSLDFCYVIDCFSQALLYEYVGPRARKLLSVGLRGAREASNLHCGLTTPAAGATEAALGVQANAECRLEGAAKCLKVEADQLRWVLTEVSRHPRTVFICKMWDVISSASGPLHDEHVATEQARQATVAKAAEAAPPVAIGPASTAAEARVDKILAGRPVSGVDPAEAAGLPTVAAPSPPASGPA
jgi:hypothetical protein